MKLYHNPATSFSDYCTCIGSNSFIQLLRPALTPLPIVFANEDSCNDAGPRASKGSEYYSIVPLLDMSTRADMPQATAVLKL